MQDMMAKGAAWFDQVRRQHLSISVTYFPVGNLIGLECAATITDGYWEAVDAAGQMVRIQTRDFFINLTDLPGDPRRGDEVVVAEDGLERTYTVQVPGGDQQAWRWADRRHQVRRIHTMETVAAAAIVSYATTELGERLTTEAGEPLVA